MSLCAGRLSNQCRQVDTTDRLQSPWQCFYAYGRSALEAGYVGVEADYVLAHDPDTVRGPDVSYVRADHIPAFGVPEGFWTLPPDLAVEIVSPSETADEVRAKVRDFLAAGTPLVWTIYPRTREVIVHTPDGLARTYSREDVLADPDVLPGFSCSVAELFA